MTEPQPNPSQQAPGPQANGSQPPGPPPSAGPHPTGQRPIVPGPPTGGYPQVPEPRVPGQQPPAVGDPAAGPPREQALDSEAEALRRSLLDVRAEVSKAVVGQDTAVTGLVIALLCQGHVLLEGVPGVAKTLLVRTLSAALGLDTKRVQFTPDLMPGDVTGSLVYDNRTSEFSFRPGPVFTNLLLADEINRTPPKTQSSLLEAMEERQVTIDGEARPLPHPFMVAATQNPVEYEGTYPLPEAQLDRFLLKLTLDLPAREHEIEILSRHAAGFNARDLEGAGVRRATDAETLDRARESVAAVHISPEVLAYVVDIVRATRHAPSFALGVSPRGAIAILATARAWAWLQGRTFVTPDDVKALLLPTARHRVQLRPEAQMEGLDVDSVLQSILRTTPAPR